MNEEAKASAGITLSLDEVAARVQGTLIVGPGSSGEVRVDGVAPLDEATATQLGLFASKRYAAAVSTCSAGALLASEALRDLIPEGVPAVVVEDPHVAMAGLLQHFHPEERRASGVHPTAVLGTGVQLGAEVHIGPYAVVGDRTAIHDGARVFAHVVIGNDCAIGARTIVHPHAVLYAGTVIGEDAIIHAGAKLGVDGFGYVYVDDQHTKVPQVGACLVGDRVEIGANSCVDRGSIGTTRIGDGTKLDNLVHLAHNVHVGKNALIVAQVGIAGSTRVGDGVVFGGQSGVINHVDIGAGARIAAKTGVIGDVAPGETVMGFPARPRREFLRAQASLGRIAAMLPRLRRLEAESDA